MHHITLYYTHTFMHVYIHTYVGTVCGYNMYFYSFFCTRSSQEYSAHLGSCCHHNLKGGPGLMVPQKCPHLDVWKLGTWNPGHRLRFISAQHVPDEDGWFVDKQFKTRHVPEPLFQNPIFLLQPTWWGTFNGPKKSWPPERMVQK